MENNLVALSSGLTLLQKTFAEKYVQTLNATQAVRECGSETKSPEVVGHQMLNHPAIKLYIQALRQQQMEKMGVTKDRVLLELARLAYVDIGDLYDEHGCLRNPKDMPEDVRRAISQIETKEIFEQDGSKKKYVGDAKRIKVSEKTKALELLAKHLGLFQLDNLQKQDVVIVVQGEETKDIWDQLQNEY